MTRTERIARNDAVAEMFKNGHDMDAVASHFDMSQDAVLKALVNRGVIKSPTLNQNQARFEQAMQLVVPSRDPCQRCGVRADVGCKHILPDWSMAA